MTSTESATLYVKVAIPSGLPGPEHFEVKRTPAASAEKEGDVRIQALVMSADPYLRNRVKEVSSEGKPLEGFMAGKITESKNSKWPVDTLVGYSGPFSSDQVFSGETLAKTAIWKLPCGEDDISLGVGVLGMPGSTAYGGLTDILKPRAVKSGATKEVLWVSAASGAVGSVLGQIAKNVFNITTVGSAGGETKCTLLKEKFGYDHVVDYKSCSDAKELTAALRNVVPDGIDMYFENVGGMHFEAALATLRHKGRIAVCGAISKYNDEPGKGAAIPEKLNITQMIYSFQRIEGFMCFPYLTGQIGSFHADMWQWYQEGHVKVEETVTEGIDNWPMAFRSLFEGTNSGKVVVRL